MATASAFFRPTMAPAALLACAGTVFAQADFPAKPIRFLVGAAPGGATDILARKRPGEMSYGSSGVGSPSHLAGELFKVIANVQFTHVPYRGKWAKVVATAGIKAEQ